jgi:hypothetical protein
MKLSPVATDAAFSQIPPFLHLAKRRIGAMLPQNRSLPSGQSIHNKSEYLDFPSYR